MQSVQQLLRVYKDRLTTPTMIAFCIALMLYAVTVTVTSETFQTANSLRSHHDGRLDLTDSILITTSEAASESLASWIKILLIVLSVETEGFVLRAASRKLYWMAVKFSGRTDGTRHFDNRSTGLGFLWSWLSSKRKSDEPWVSVLSLTLLPIVLLSVICVYPSATVVVSIPK